jgi:MFS family permease
MGGDDRSRGAWRRGNVLWLGIVSLLTDASSEMVVPLLPLFLTTVLNGGPLALGWIEGAADATSSLLKLFSGRWSDRTGRRRPLVLAGYGLSTVARPLVAVAGAPWHVLVVRVTDRVGKGIRSSPRDALIAGSVGPDDRGAAFGFHRAMDHAGAVIGPLLALAALWMWPGDLRTVFALAAIPGVFAVMAIAIGVREAAPTAPPVAQAPLGKPPPELRGLLAAVALFTLGNASDVFLLLRAGGEVGSTTTLPLLWMAFHVVKVASSLLGGRLSDRIDRRRVILAGWIVYALVYAAFAYVEDPLAVAALFVVYGTYHGLTEGAERALVADLAPAGARGTAFGWYNLVVGLLALPASVMFGFLWEYAGAPVAFLTGSALALAAALVLAAAVRAPPEPAA